ncbi:hypothetical protein XA68_10493 [Ophiocordyceps unilateralis]|uniref:Peptidase S8/S53 domain-containing protein n=1 Tax=Ophiocordyceps unilateralis TaxID=268505 RepID=A0A2A9P2T8_OPHUN|nr:hypothetical protein XA68_10493 [Ophiocordyceps unilateralis]
MVRAATVITLTAATTAAAAAAALSAPNRPAAAVVPGAYIIELEQGHDHDDVYREVNKQGTTRMQLNYKLFRGVSVQLSHLDSAPQKAARLAAMPAVRNVWPVQLYAMPSPKVEWVGTEPMGEAVPRRLMGRADDDGDGKDVYPPHVMTQVDRLRDKGVTGKGMRVAVIDTGIDYLHPALGGCFGPGCLVSFGLDYVGDAFNGTNTPVPGTDPMDCAGHGTHVAGIVAAQGGEKNRFAFTGVAPDVTLGAYRVFGCTGSASNEVLIAAYNQAFEDGADIITASIGGPKGWPEDPWSETVSRIVAQGVPCTVSAGNEGENGLMYASSAADGRGVLSVASFDNAVTPVLLYRVSYSVDGGPDRVFGYAPGEPDAWDGVTMPLKATSLDPTVTADACRPLLPDPAPPSNATRPGNNGTELAGHVVLVRRGNCTFVEKAANVAARGGHHILFYNNDPEGATAVDLTGLAGILAGGMVTAEVGQAWLADLRLGRRIVVKMASRNHTESSLRTVVNKATGGAVSTFSSWGPTWEMDVKPQFGAPGGSIISTWPRKLGQYAVLSGTSMACPLAAGIIALIGQVRGSLDPKMLESVLSNTAKPALFNDGKTFSDYLAPVAQQGGGLVQAFDAAFTKTLLTPSSLSFNDSDHFAASLNFTITNLGHDSVQYRLSHVPAVTMYTLGAGSTNPSPFPNDVLRAAVANISLSCETLTLGPGETARIDVEADPPPGLDARRLALWSGYVAVNGSDGSAVSIPYQGLTGSLRRSRVLGEDAVYISKSTDKLSRPLPANTTFVLPAPGTAWQGIELPAIVVDPVLGSPLQRVDVVPLFNPPPRNTTVYKGVKTIGQPSGFPSYWNTRGPNPNPWDGLLDSGLYAPPGLYKFVVRALHIFGDARNESDWDVSETTALRIKYA